jgi:hypothetical protein
LSTASSRAQRVCSTRWLSLRPLRGACFCSVTSLAATRTLPLARPSRRRSSQSCAPFRNGRSRLARRQNKSCSLSPSSAGTSKATAILADCARSWIPRPAHHADGLACPSGRREVINRESSALARARGRDTQSADVVTSRRTQSG